MIEVLWVSFWVIWVIAVLMVLFYGWVILFGAPYVPTLQKQRQAAIKLLELKPGQVFVDLGSGDGSSLILAAQQGATAIGYELNPFLVLISWVRTRPYRQRVKIVMGNFWRADLSNVDAIFVFLIGHYMKKLDQLIVGQPHKRLRIVSNTFAIPGRKALAKKGPLYLYVYPAKR